MPSCQMNVKGYFKSFFIETIILILTIYGRVNFLSMSRQGESCESRFRQNFKKQFDWCSFNAGMLRPVDSNDFL